MHERVSRAKGTGHGRRIKRIASDDFGTGWYSASRRSARERSNAMTARDEALDQKAADVAGTAGNEDIHQFVASAFRRTSG
jgi:hypothetical protein